MSGCPFERAMAVYENEPCARSFEEDLMLHLRYGYVFSTPEFFVMGRPVLSTARPEYIVNPAYIWPGHLCDCWHIYLFAGEVNGRAWEMVPWALPRFSFERGNRLKVVSARKLQQLSKQHT